MSKLRRSIMQAAAGAAGEAIYVDDVFSTYLYTGNGSTQTITNGIDLDGEGGLWWFKERSGSGTASHYLFDTERGDDSPLQTNSTNAAGSGWSSYFEFLSNGFSASGSFSNGECASWTFRKAPGFFDVVTWTGNGTTGRTISHNLGCKPGCIIVKTTSTTSIWAVWHKKMAAEADLYKKTLRLNSNIAVDDTYGNDWGSTNNVTNAHFQVGGAGGSTNVSGETYVAYLFADGDDAAAQIFGTDGDQAVVKCGSYTGDDSTDGSNHIDLGFEPQWLLVKCSTHAEDWLMYDNMRGVVNNGYDAQLEANTSDAETTPAYNFLRFTATGFAPETGDTKINEPGRTYVYIAIRRPHKPAESGSEVFAPTVHGNNATFDVGFPTDANIVLSRAVGSNAIQSRLTPNYLITNTTASEGGSSLVEFDLQNSFYVSWTSSNVSYNFRRSPGFFDVVAYEGTGSTQNISHNLGVAPEMMIVRARDSARDWAVYHNGINDITKKLTLNTTDAIAAATNVWASTSPTDAVFTVGSDGESGGSGYNYIAYLFASQDGISKVGSYTGNGSSQTIDCGFTNGARFVLIKRTNTTGNWNVWDSERGIVAGNDPRLELNTTDAEDTGHDYIDPASSGFTVNYVADDDDDTNVSGDEYIYLAIA